LLVLVLILIKSWHISEYSIKFITVFLYSFLKIVANAISKIVLFCYNFKRNSEWAVKNMLSTT